MTETTNLTQQTPQNRGENTRNGNYFVPRVDIHETEHELVLQADLPGVGSGDVDLRYENGELVLHGKVNPRQRGGRPVLGEWEEGGYYRVFTIHESIDATRIEAECKQGVLTVHLPKVEAAKPRQVQVKG